MELSLEAKKIYPISINQAWVVIAVSSDVLVARTSILGLSDFFRINRSLFDNFSLLLDELFGHFVKIQAVNLGEMSRFSALKGVDGRSLHAILDVSQSGSPK